MRRLVDKVFKDENGNELHYAEFAGDSSEVGDLPTENMVDSSNFLATDTAEVWFFNEKTSSWKKA